MTFTCQHCQQPFTARYGRDRKYCGKPCQHAAQKAQQRGKQPVWATQARRGQQMAEARDGLRRQFGDFSVREVELFKAVYWWAYRKGYGQAYRRRSSGSPQERQA